MSRSRGIRIRDLIRLIRRRLSWPELVRWIVWSYAMAMQGRDGVSKADKKRWAHIAAAMHEFDDCCKTSADHVVACLKDGDCKGPWCK